MEREQELVNVPAGGREVRKGEKRMKKVLSVVLAATMVMSLAACGGGNSAKTDTKAADAGSGSEAAASADAADDFQITIKFSNVFQPAEWNYKASEYLADLVKEKTEGHIILEYYGQNQLDCYAESVAQAHNGAVWMGLEEPSYFADYIGDYNVLVGPMLYKNNAEYNAVMDSDIVKDLIRAAATISFHPLNPVAVPTIPKGPTPKFLQSMIAARGIIMVPRAILILLRGHFVTMDANPNEPTAAQINITHKKIGSHSTEVVKMNASKITGNVSPTFSVPGMLISSI